MPNYGAAVIARKSPIKICMQPVGAWRDKVENINLQDIRAGIMKGNVWQILRQLTHFSLALSLGSTRLDKLNTYVLAA